MLKTTLLATTLFSIAFLALPIHADTATRCMELIDRRVQGNTLQLANCNLRVQQAQSILNYLQNHPEITELNIDNNAEFGSAGVKILAQNNTLQTLSITGTNVADEGYAALAKNTSLKTLIRQDEDTYSFQAPVQLEGNHSLTSVTFENSRITDEAVLTLAKINSLEEVNIASFFLNLNPASILALNNLPNLTKLNVTGDYTSDTTLAKLANNLHLKELSFGESMYGAGAETLKAIAKNPNLTKVSMTISADHIGDFILLKNNSTITSLAVQGELTNETIAIIASFKNLTELKLFIYSDDINLIPLTELPKLKSLQISSRWFIDDITANALAMNKNITDLTLDNLTESAALKLAQSNTLQRLNINNKFYDPDGENNNPNDVNLILNKSLGALAKIPSLVELTYTGNYKIDKDVATDIISNPSLKKLHFERDNVMTKISNSAFQVFAQATNLNDLKLSSEDIDDNAAITLGGNQILQRLSLETTKLSDKGLKGLAKNNTLTSLELNIGPVTATAYNALMANKNVVYLDVNINFNPKQRIKLNGKAAR